MARILLADDDKPTRDLVKRALETDGHIVEVAQDGSEALDSLTSGLKADLLVTDVNMPGLDGISLAKKAQALNPAMRILMMSGFADELERAKLAATGHVAVLSKPFSLEHVRAAVRDLIAA
jgi:two-component system cell cycle response regulator CpdR